VSSETVRSYDRDAAAYVARTATVPDSVRAALEHFADRLGPGARSNGDRFTVESLGSYHLHDVVHHLHDVGAG